MERKYGWRRGLPDHRDHNYSAPHGMAPLPNKVDLRPTCPPVYNQLKLGSCTAQAIGGHIHFNQIRQGKKAPWTPSRLFIYYNERLIEGTVREDSGAEIRNGIKSVAKWGVCPEDLWPYDVRRYRNKPGVTPYRKALNCRIASYQKLDNTNLFQLQSCLAEGLPFVFGFVVYESFEGEAIAKTGQFQIPEKSERMLGGHAVMCVGYDDDAQSLIVRNSYGADWGVEGYMFMPYDFVTSNQYCDDFWVIKDLPKTA